MDDAGYDQVCLDDDEHTYVNGQQVHDSDGHLYSTIENNGIENENFVLNINSNNSNERSTGHGYMSVVGV